MRNVFIALGLAAVLVVGAVAFATTETAENVRGSPDPFYGRTDGWGIEPTSYDHEVYVDGSVVFSLDIAGEVLTFANSETIKNDNDGEIEFGDGTEDFALSFGTNSANFSSDTGVIAVDLTQITTVTLGNDETIKNDNDGEIEFGNGTEDSALSWGTNILQLSSDTGVVGLDLTQITTLTLGNDETIKNDNNGEIEFGDGTEDLALSFGTNTASWSSDTSVVVWDMTQITSIILGNDETIKNDNNGEIEFGNGTEDLAISFGTNVANWTTDTGVVEVNYPNSIKLTAGNLHTDKVEITNGELLALRATNKTLVAEQGANTIIEVVSLLFMLDYGSAACTESADNLEVHYVDAAGIKACATAFETTGSFLVGTADSYAVYECDGVGVGVAAEMVNTAVTLDNNGDGEFGTCTGSTVDVWITYRVHDIS